MSEARTRREKRDKRGGAYRWALRVLYLMLFLAIFGDFLANDKPLLCRYEGRLYFPVLKAYAVDRGWSQWPDGLANARWRDLELELEVWPPVPYTAEATDLRNANYVSPTEEQRVESWRRRHWLGTDQLGRDVLAGMISGTRTAMLVGLVAMGVAAVIGITLGALAGFLGNDGWRLARARWWGAALGFLLGAFYGCAVVPHWEGPVLWRWLLGLLSVVLPSYFGGLLLARIWRGERGREAVALPVDDVVMRLVEIVNGVPALLLLLSVVAILHEPRLLSVMVIIGFLRWTTIARFVRAEMLRVRRLEYMEAARVLGLGRGRMLLRHALPNALDPVVIALAFGMAGAVLLEAILSFLGIGLPPNLVTWGSMLQHVRRQPDAWWLVVFPGLAIFVTIAVFNLLGEALRDSRSSERV